MSLFKKKKGIEQIRQGIVQFVISEFNTFNNGLSQYYELHEDSLLLSLLSVACTCAENDLVDRGLEFKDFPSNVLEDLFTLTQMPEEVHFEFADVFFNIDNEIKNIVNENNNWENNVSDYIYEISIIKNLQFPKKDEWKQDTINQITNLVKAFKVNIDAAILDKKLEITF